MNPADIRDRRKEIDREHKQESFRGQQSGNCLCRLRRGDLLVSDLRLFFHNRQSCLPEAVDDVRLADAAVAAEQNADGGAG